MLRIKLTIYILYIFYFLYTHTATVVCECLYSVIGHIVQSCKYILDKNMSGNTFLGNHSLIPTNKEIEMY